MPSRDDADSPRPPERRAARAERARAGRSGGAAGDRSASRPPHPGFPALRVEVVAGAARPSAARGLARWLARVAPRRARGAVTLALVGDARMRALNRAWRGLDEPTDVLSFPSGEAPGPTRRRRGDDASEPVLGDIAIALGVARRQARRLGHPLATELRVLALHGLLHLLGYDHERDRGEMRRLERRLLRKGGIAGGLISRPAGGRR